MVKKYIEAGEFGAWLKEWEDEYLKAFNDLGEAKKDTEGLMLNAARTAFQLSRLHLESTPAADVQKVRHGTWVRVDPTSTVVTWRCSECSFYAHMRNTDYCPNCGALMDGGKTNDTETSD